MAFIKKNLAQRLLNISRKLKINPTNGNVSSSKAAPEPERIFHRFLQRRPISTTELLSLPKGEKLMEKIRGMEMFRDRINLEGLHPPVVNEAEENISLDEARKVLRAWRMETVRSKLRETEMEQISFAEFVEICSGVCSHGEEAVDLTKSLDESGTVIVLGNVVYLRPDKIIKTIQGLMPAVKLNALNHKQQYEDLERMEKQKANINKQAESMVRRELWLGLGCLVIQTTAFMRLTFWELSWGVMEPVCFFVTSTYFMGSYAFFLRTSKEPSFESFYSSCFRVKQKQLMEKLDFDVRKYNELRTAACYPQYASTLNKVTIRT